MEMSQIEDKVFVGDLNEAAELMERMDTCERAWRTAICVGDTESKAYWFEQWRNAHDALEELKRVRQDEKHKQLVKALVEDLQQRGVDASVVVRVHYVALDGEVI